MINQALIVGRIANDLYLQQTGTGKNVISFTIACERPKQKDKESEADFIKCVAWNHTAKYISDYCKKGSALTIQGRLQSRSYDDKDGKKVFLTEIVVEQVNLHYGKKEEPAAASNDTEYQPSYSGGYDDFSPWKQ